MSQTTGRRGGESREKEIDMNTSIFQKAVKAKDKIVGTAMMTAAAYSTSPVFAADPGTTSGSMNVPTVNIDSVGSDPTALVGKALGLVFVFSKWIGAFLMIWGAFMLFNAMKNDEAESKSRAIMTLAAGAGLVALQTIMAAVGVTSS